ncbi:MAG: hypothetical protein R3F59_04195 [Myxococcota bacterium]
MRLQLDGDHGTLTYLRKAAVLQLTGACGSPCVLDERGPDGAPTGHIEAAWQGDALTGTWRTPDGKTSLPLAARRGPDAAVVDLRPETWTRANRDKWSGPTIAVTLPHVYLADPAAQSRADALLTPQQLIGDPRAQIEADGWVDAVRTTVLLERGGVLSLRVDTEGSGAYPDGYSKAVILDERTGAAIGPETFSPAGRAALTAKVAAEVAKRKAAATSEVQELVAGVQFTEKQLVGFAVSPAGLEVPFGWGLPHVLAAAIPDEDVVLPWSAVAEALAPGSPLARAVPKP